MSNKQKFVPYLFLLLPLLLYTIWIILPVFYSFYISLTDWHGVSQPRFIGLKNYRKLFSDPVFWKSITNNFIWLSIFIVFPVLLGLLLALLLDREIKGKKIFKTIFYSPMVLSFVVIGLMWSWIYNPSSGILNVTLRKIGLDFLALGWLSNPHLVLYSIIFAASWRQTSYTLILFLTGLSNIPSTLVEAAQIDGASYWQVVRYVILPQLKPATVIAITVTIIGALRVFDLVYTMTRGGPSNASNVLANFMYMETFHNYRMGYGAAIAVILFLITLIFIITYLRKALKTEIEY